MVQIKLSVVFILAAAVTGIAPTLALPAGGRLDAIRQGEKNVAKYTITSKPRISSPLTKDTSHTTPQTPQSPSSVNAMDTTPDFHWGSSPSVPRKKTIDLHPGMDMDTRPDEFMTRVPSQTSPAQASQTHSPSSGHSGSNSGPVANKPEPKSTWTNLL